MPHGTPDWGERSPKITTYTLSDMAELAVRLGSFVNYDRRGEVIWMSGFDEGGRGYGYSGTGVGFDIYLSSDLTEHGGLCLILVPGNAVGDLIQIHKVMRYPVISGIGLEATFTPDPLAEWVELRLRIFDGVNLTSYAVRYVHFTGTVEVYDQAGAWVTVGTPGKMRDTYAAYTQFKLVIDLVSGNYARVMINDNTYLATVYSGFVAADLTAKSITGLVNVWRGAAGVCEVRLDNLIITQNEPV